MLIRGNGGALARLAQRGRELHSRIESDSPDVFCRSLFTIAASAGLTPEVSRIEHGYWIADVFERDRYGRFPCIRESLPVSIW